MNAPFQTSVVNEQCPFVVFLLSAAGIYVFTVSLLLKMGIGDSKGWGGRTGARIRGSRTQFSADVWALKGVHWPGRGTYCIIKDPRLAFGPMPDSAASEKDWFFFEMGVFSSLCKFMRQRASELAEGPHLENRDFHRKYTFVIDHGAQWDKDTFEKIRHLIARLNIRCIRAGIHGGTSSEMEWHRNSAGTMHICILHHLPLLDEVVHEPNEPRDKSLETYFYHIRKMEYEAYLKYKRDHPEENINIDNVKFAYDDIRNARLFRNEQRAWGEMWDAAHIYQHDDQLETLDDWGFGPSHAETHGPAVTARYGNGYAERGTRNKHILHNSSGGSATGPDTIDL
jgi:hypothetical protein